MSKLTVLLVDDHEGFINAAMRHFRKVEWLNRGQCRQWAGSDRAL